LSLLPEELVFPQTSHLCILAAPPFHASNSIISLERLARLTKWMALQEY